MKFPYSAMFFRRTKRPGTDETVLTETLRSLQDLISDPQAASQTQSPDTSAAGDDPGAAASPGAAQGQGNGAGGEESSPPPPQPAPPDGGALDAASDHDDDIPVLNSVVYMPIPRVPAARSTVSTAAHEDQWAQRAIADKLVGDIEDHLGNQGEGIDPRLLDELRTAVTSSLEDWSLRTQELILSKLSPKKRARGEESGDGS